MGLFLLVDEGQTWSLSLFFFDNNVRERRINESLWVIHFHAESNTHKASALFRSCMVYVQSERKVVARLKKSCLRACATYFLYSFFVFSIFVFALTRFFFARMLPTVFCTQRQSFDYFALTLFFSLSLFLSYMYMHQYGAAHSGKAPRKQRLILVVRYCIVRKLVLYITRR